MCTKNYKNVYHVFSGVCCEYLGTQCSMNIKADTTKAAKAKVMTWRQFDCKFKEACNKAINENKRVQFSCDCGVFMRVYAGTGKAVFYWKKPVIDSKSKKRVYKDTTIGTYDPDNKKHSMSLSDARKIVANSKEERKEELKANENQPVDTTPLFKDYWAQWLDQKNKDGLSKARIFNLKSYHNACLYSLDEYKLSEITPSIINQKIGEADTSDGNKHFAVEALKGLFDAALIPYCDFIHFNPAAVFKGRANPFKRPKAIGLEFVKAEALKELVFKPESKASLLTRCYVLLVALSGLRPSEARNMCWSWIEEGNTLHVPPEFAKTRVDYYNVITDQMKRLLDKIKALTEGNRHGRDHVFYGDTFQDKPKGKGYFWAEYKALIPKKPNEKRGKDVSVHDLHGFRKSLRTWLADNKCPERIAEMMLNHEDMNKTERAYNKAFESYQIEKLKWLQKYNDYLEKSQLTKEFKQLIQ